MAITFICGIAIIKAWLDFSLDAYNAYLLATFGLGIAIVLREWVRLTLVPLQKGTEADLGPLVSVCLLFGVANFAVVAVIIMNLSVFNIAAEYSEGFALYLLARATIYFLVFFILPLINHSLSSGNPRFYNFFLAGERVMELLCVLGAIFYYQTYGDGLFVTLSVMTAVGYVFLVLAFLFFFHRAYRSVSIIPASPFLIRQGQLGQQLKGNFYLVANMALYFRLSVALANALFEPLIAAVFGLCVQVAGYVRQISMGVMAGIDSYFSSGSLRKNVDGLKRADNVNLIFLSISAGLAVGFSPLIVEFMLSDHASGDEKEVSLILQLIVVGVYLKSLSEGWMHYLRGVGLVEAYAKPLLAIAFISPLSWFLLFVTGVSSPAAFYAGVFVMLMFFSHLVVLPQIFKRHKPDVYRQAVTPVLVKSTLPIMLLGSYVLLAYTGYV